MTDTAAPAAEGTSPERPYLYFVSYAWRHGPGHGYGWRTVATSHPVTSATGIESLTAAIADVLAEGHTIVPLHFHLLAAPAAAADPAAGDLAGEPCL